MRVYGKREGYGEPDAAPSHVTSDALVPDVILAYEEGLITNGEAKTLIREHFGLGVVGTAVREAQCITGQKVAVHYPVEFVGGKWYGADGREIKVMLT